MNPYRYPEPTPEPDPFPEGEKKKASSIEFGLDDEDRERIEIVELKKEVEQIMARDEARRRYGLMLERAFDITFVSASFFLVGISVYFWCHLLGIFR